MARNARLEADALIDEMSRLPIKKQPRWFKEMFKNWVAGVSVSDDYSNPEGLPDSETEDAAPVPEGVVDDVFDESFADVFDDTCDIIDADDVTDAELVEED